MNSRKDDIVRPAGHRDQSVTGRPEEEPFITNQEKPKNLEKIATRAIVIGELAIFAFLVAWSIKKAGEWHIEIIQAVAEGVGFGMIFFGTGWYILVRVVFSVISSKYG